MKALAEQMEVSAASATNMLKRLDELKLVAYSRYKGVTLTDPGRKIALGAGEPHRDRCLEALATFDGGTTDEPA